MTDVERDLLGVVFKRVLTNNRVTLAETRVFVFVDERFIDFDVGLHRSILLGIEYVLTLVILDVVSTRRAVALGCGNRDIHAVCAVCANFVELGLGE